MKLSKPIKAHGEEIAELSFREPTAKDIQAFGYPFSSDGESTLPRAKVVGRYIVELCAIPLSSVDQLCPGDFLLATAEVLGFFGTATPEEANPAPK